MPIKRNNADSGPAAISRDVSDIGHFGTDNLELTIGNEQDLAKALPFVELAYQEIGG